MLSEPQACLGTGHRIGPFAKRVLHDVNESH